MTYSAVEYTEYGDSSVLTLVQRESLTAGPGQVRLAVRAAGVNQFDWKVRRGLMADMTPAHFPVVPGGEVAGVVDQVGEGVTEFAVGDEVLGRAPSGSYAESVLAPVDSLVRKPANVSWEVAGGLLVVAGTSYRALALLKVAAGDTIVINGASGGVGTIAVQTAVARSLTVIGTASETNHNYLRSLGAVPVAYGDGLIERVRAAAPQGVSAALDIAGSGVLPQLIELTGRVDKVITIADRDANRYGVRFTGGASDEEIPGALEEVVGLVAAGKVTLPIAQAFPLAEAGKAQDVSESGHVRGKLVLVP
ncbi:MAG TPA: NADP-dependent oxidoreductase [Mycobacteriales bacterium]|jgi:NADPH:quinone reductase-like Zn-dependent oxidoreductase|nr:NADP-dependent oxidoreductase [Mycobacteriales bacterium]